MNRKEVEISEKLFRTKYELLGAQEKHVAHHLAERTRKLIYCGKSNGASLFQCSRNSSGF